MNSIPIFITLHHCCCALDFQQKEHLSLQTQQELFEWLTEHLEATGLKWPIQNYMWVDELKKSMFHYAFIFHSYNNYIALKTIQ